MHFVLRAILFYLIKIIILQARSQLAARTPIPIKFTFIRQVVMFLFFRVCPLDMCVLLSAVVLTQNYLKE
jgi:hypothetical protein